MATVALHEQGYRRDLGGGLVLRWSDSTDLEGLIKLYTHVFRRKPDEPPSQTMTAWLNDMGSGKHPLITANDFALVEDTDRGIFVAATCLIQQPIDFAGIPLTMGRPEVVATHEDYRNRGLIRAIFELIHARSEARGHQFQGITGIPYYYRQFGYEFAVPLDGGRTVLFADIPKLKEGENEPYTLRPATLADQPVLQAIYERERTIPRRYAPGYPPIAPLVTVPVPDEYWRWTLDGIGEMNGESWRSLLIVNGEGRTVGYVLRHAIRWGNTVGLRGVMVEPGVSLAAVLPSVLRGIQALAPAIPTGRPDVPAPDRVQFRFFASHPLYDLLDEMFAARVEHAYAWYIRVPDLPAFLQQIAPVLERRLADSIFAGHTGELRIEFYRGGLRLAFENGRLVAAENWQKPVWEPRPQAGFPPLMFLQLLFGHRSLQALSDFMPDVWTDDDIRPLIDVLFPPQPSWLLPLD